MYEEIDLGFHGRRYVENCYPGLMTVVGHQAWIAIFYNMCEVCNHPSLLSLLMQIFQLFNVNVFDYMKFSKNLIT